MFRKYRYLKQFNKYLKKYKKTIVILVIVMIMASSLGMILPYLYSQRLIGITETKTNIVILYSIVIIVTILFHHIFWYLWEKIASKITNKVLLDIRKGIVKNILNTKYINIKNNTSGYYLERIRDDVTDVACVMPNLLGTLVDSLTNFSFLVYIFILNFKCGLIFLLGILLLYFIDVMKIKKDIKYTEKIKKLEEKLNTRVNEIYVGIKEIKGLGIQDVINYNTINISENITNLKIKKDNIIAILSRLKTFSQYLLEMILILYSVVYLIPNNNFTVVGLLMVINYSGFMYDLVGCFASMKDCMEKGNYKAERILEVINEKNIQQYGKINEIDNYSIQIKNLSYKYENTKQCILKNISLNIKQNTTSLFVGNSGNGKSTLFSIIYKLLNVENNQVFIGEKDINKLSKDFFDKNLCIVNQEPFLLNDSIINNLKLVNENADLNDIYNACEKANIHNEILKMKDGYNTIISENGNNLSGGQKQRLSIARAILKDSKIILFDEPTSALDKENQKMFFQTIEELKNKKTILIIAHKFEDLKTIDNIYEVKNGSVVKRILNNKL